jgi:hypothetical protein
MPMVEIVERLSLPPGLHGEVPKIAKSNQLPTSPADARVAFTYLARALARDYRVHHAHVVRTDITSLAFMQRELRHSFPSGASSEHDVISIRRHGAFLSEMIARTLGGFWQDIAPTEIGYWSMIVPPNTRVLPFGRILRFLALGPKYQDLTTLYAGLEARARTLGGSR